MFNLSFSRCSSFFVAVFVVGERGLEWDFIAPSVEDEMALGVDLVFFFREGGFGGRGAVGWVALYGVEGGALLLLVEGRC
jgi:hypothetical protein